MTRLRPAPLSGLGWGRPKESGLKLQFLATRNPRLARLVPRDKTTSFGQPPVVYCVREVRLAKRLDIAAAERKWRARLGPQIERNLDRMSASAGLPS